MRSRISVLIIEEERRCVAGGFSVDSVKSVSYVGDGKARTTPTSHSFQGATSNASCASVSKLRALGKGNDRRWTDPPATWIRLPNTAMMASCRGQEASRAIATTGARRIVGFERAIRREVTTVLHLAPGSVDDAVQSGRVEPAACVGMGVLVAPGVRGWIVGLHQIDVARKADDERPAQPPTIT